MLLNKKNLILIFLLFLILPCLYAQEEFVYNAKGKRNPFIPLVTAEGRLLKLDKDKEQDATQQGLTVEGIIYDKLGRSFAIVNTNVVGIGDMVGDFQVLKILDHKVIFIRNGEPLEVELTKEEAK
jgi:competence protein ComGC